MGKKIEALAHRKNPVTGLFLDCDCLYCLSCTLKFITVNSLLMKQLKFLLRFLLTSVIFSSLTTFGGVVGGFTGSASTGISGGIFGGILVSLIGCSSSGGIAKNSTEIAAAPENYQGFSLTKTYEPLDGLKIFHYTHAKSGLEILLSPRLGSNVVAYVTAYNVGSRFEMPGRTGLAHLFEHMMFRGTENFQKPFQTLSGWGNSFNAYTSFDLTVYYQTVPKSVFAEMVGFEAERMRKLLITEEGYKQERGSVISERKMRTEDSPAGRLFWELYQNAFRVHPYQTPPIGWQEDLNATTFEDALNFYNRFYAPNRAVISLVGDFQVAEALELIHQNYGTFEKVAFQEPKIPQEPRRTQNIRKVIPMKTEAVILAHAIEGLSVHDDSVASDSLFCTLLTDSRIGYLNTELVEKNLARSVSANCSPNVDKGLSTLFVYANPGISIAAIEKAFDEAMKGFPKWISEERIIKAKMYYFAAQYSGMRDPDNLAETLARGMTLSSNPMHEFDFLKKAQDVSLKDVLSRYANWNQKKYVRLIAEPSSKNPPFVYPSRYKKFLNRQLNR